MVGSRFRVNEEYSRAAGALARSFVDNLEPFRLHRIEGLLGAFHPERDMSQTAPATIPFNQLLHRRIRAEWLKQLNKVRTLTDLQQGFAHLIRSMHFLAVNFAEAHHLIGL